MRSQCWMNSLFRRAHFDALDFLGGDAGAKSSI